jgi:polyphosphate kinase
MYWFRNGGEDELYIGSADLMERNLDRRVEVMVPVRDSDIRAHLRDIVLNAYLRDTERAMTLDADGRYEEPAAGSGSFDSQAFLLEHYNQRAD